MTQRHFDFHSYGAIQENELLVSLQMAKASPSPKSGSLRPGIHLQEKPANPHHIQATLEFHNISSRDLNIISRFWFMKLEILANEKSIGYQGPMVSLPPPKKSDYVTLKPGEKYSTEPIILNSYFNLADEFKGVLKVKYQYSPQVLPSFAEFSN